MNVLSKVKKMKFSRQIVRLFSKPRTSLIEQTMKEFEGNEELKLSLKTIQEIGQKRLTIEERKKRRRSLQNLNIPSFFEYINNQGLHLTRKSPSIFQLNLGLFCNQACTHCHVESSPTRKETMSQQIAERCIQLIDSSPSIKTLDLTGGAPELQTTFRYLVKEGRARGLEVIDRCNLTVLMEPGQEDLAQFLADNQVRVVASLPCYSERNVNLQRGRDVFSRSIQGLQLLNSLGYGQPSHSSLSPLILDLIYNPGGAFLPPSQSSLEKDYKEKLSQEHDIQFHSLLTITNMPIKRYADLLYKQGKLDEYMQLLVTQFNPHTVDKVMCRDTISVGWDGKIYDCDFNQQLALELGNFSLVIDKDESSTTTSMSPSTVSSSASSKTVFSINSLNELIQVPILTDNHCFGCTAGSGSSCQGAVA